LFLLFDFSNLFIKAFAAFLVFGLLLFNCFSTKDIIFSFSAIWSNKAKKIE